MGTTGSVDGAGRLVIKGRFQQKQIENVLRRYMGELRVILNKQINNLKNRLSTTKKNKQSNTSPAKLANHQILFSQRKTVSSSWLVNRVGVGGPLMPSRVDSRRKLGSEVRIRRVDFLRNIAVISVYLGCVY